MYSHRVRTDFEPPW